MRPVSINDLAGVVYSSGKVFDNLGTGRLDTENFLRAGSTEGVTSAADLQLLEDLRDVATFITEHTTSEVDADYVIKINSLISRSGAIRNGQLRRPEAHVGVTTRYGRHEPEALTKSGLQRLIDGSLAHPDPIENALALFVALAKAQPFEDGNKRTALFSADAYLIGLNAGKLVTVPVDDNDPQVADRFNDALARAYVYGEDDKVIDLMRETVTEIAGA